MHGLSIGMTPQQVEARLGRHKPVHAPYWIYDEQPADSHNRAMTVSFKNGRVSNLFGHQAEFDGQVITAGMPRNEVLRLLGRPWFTMGDGQPYLDLMPSEMICGITYDDEKPGFPVLYISLHTAGLSLKRITSNPRSA